MEKDLAECDLPFLLELRDIDEITSTVVLLGDDHELPADFVLGGSVVSELVIVNTHFL